MTTLEYDVVSEPSIQALVDKVNLLLKEGWKLHGGIAMASYADGYTQALQAVVRGEPK